MISTWQEAKRRKKYPRAQEEKMLQKRRFPYIKKRKNEKPTWKTEIQSIKRNVKCKKKKNAKATAKYKIKMMQKKEAIVRKVFLKRIES